MISNFISYESPLCLLLGGLKTFRISSFGMARYKPSAYFRLFVTLSPFLLRSALVSAKVARQQN